MGLHSFRRYAKIFSSLSLALSSRSRYPPYGWRVFPYLVPCGGSVLVLWVGLGGRCLLGRLWGEICLCGFVGLPWSIGGGLVTCLVLWLPVVPWFISSSTVLFFCSSVLLKYLFPGCFCETPKIFLISLMIFIP